MKGGAVRQDGARARAERPRAPLGGHAVALASRLSCVPLFPLGLQVFKPATPQADSIMEVSNLVLVIALAIFVLVQGSIIYFIIRFRRRGTEEEGPEPPQFYGSAPIEVAWTVAPLLTVFVIFLVVMRTTHELRSMPRHDPTHVTVNGYRWWWEYRYEDTPDGDPDAAPVITANELHVPTGKPTVLRLLSADVIHSFWLPRLNGKTDVIPGHPNEMEFLARSPGLYRGQCGEFCGTQHAHMMLRVIAEPEERFERWLAHQREPAADDPSVASGRQMFLDLACSNCHTIRGTPADGVNGPDLTHLMTRRTLASGMIENDRENLAAWIRDPQSVKPGCLMPNMRLTRSQVTQLTDYLMSLD